MKFGAFKEFRDSLNTAGITEVVRYLAIDMVNTLRELNAGLSKLTFSENFQSFTWTGTIAAGTEVSIRNGFRAGVIPSGKLIVRADVHSADVTDGAAAWTENYVSLKNNGASAATVTVIFFR